MISQIRWHQAGAEVNPFGFLNIARFYMEWSNGRQMDKYVGKLLDEPYEDYKNVPENTRSKAVIDLVLQAYLPGDSKVMPDKLDPEFRAFAIRQIRFVFVGHDSTSSTICYCFQLLSKNPDALARIRTEHDSVFGTDISAVSSLLISRPHLINSLPYTTGVIKETLRRLRHKVAGLQGICASSPLSALFLLHSTPKTPYISRLLP
jgi:cytochrome P450